MPCLCTVHGPLLDFLSVSLPLAAAQVRDGVAAAHGPGAGPRHRAGASLPAAVAVVGATHASLAMPSPPPLLQTSVTSTFVAPRPVDEEAGIAGGAAAGGAAAHAAAGSGAGAAHIMPAFAEDETRTALGDLAQQVRRC